VHAVSLLGRIVVVAVMLALPLVFAPFRALIGHRSDTHRSALGWRRVPFIWKGTLLQFGGFSIMPFALLVLAGQGEAAYAPVWIGFGDDGTGSFSWTDGTPVGSVFWDLGTTPPQPDNAGSDEDDSTEPQEDCTWMDTNFDPAGGSYGLWSDEDCSINADGYVCEWVWNETGP